MNALTQPQNNGYPQPVAPLSSMMQFAQDMLPKSFEQAVQLAEMMAKSGLVPAHFNNKPEACLIAIISGASLGFNPLQSVKSIAVIHGTPCLWGDAMIALVRASPLCEWIKETFEGDTAYCTVKRRSEPEPQTRSFSWEDAVNAGLTQKKGEVWNQYAKRMLQMRARGFALRDIFPDVLAGFGMAEEIRDITPSENAAAQFNAPVIPAKPAYPQEKLESYLPEWQQAIAGGKDPEQVISMVGCKYQLTDAQKAQIRALADKPKGETENNHEQG